VGWPLIAYRVSHEPYRLVPADRTRQWMEETSLRFAYRCLPLSIANQSGWFILNPQRFRVAWNGDDGTDAILFDFFGEPPVASPASHFGYGILTWNLPFLFRTPPGWNLLARGPSNWPKDGIAPLEGVVETDWAVATFTMNWKFTSPDRWVTFDEGEPICMIVPQRRGDLEAFAPRIQPIAANPDLRHEFDTWREGRGAFNAGLRFGDEEARREGWQRHYIRGITPLGTRAPQHQTQRHLQGPTESRPIVRTAPKRGGASRRPPLDASVNRIRVARSSRSGRSASAAPHSDVAE
jgi:hypothetical protein